MIVINRANLTVDIITHAMRPYRSLPSTMEGEMPKMPIEWNNPRGLAAVEHHAGPRELRVFTTRAPIIYDAMYLMGSRFYLPVLTHGLRAHKFAIVSKAHVLRSIKSVIWYINAADDVPLFAELVRGRHPFYQLREISPIDKPTPVYVSRPRESNYRVIARITEEGEEIELPGQSTELDFE